MTAHWDRAVTKKAQRQWESRGGPCNPAWRQEKLLAVDNTWANRQGANSRSGGEERRSGLRNSLCKGSEVPDREGEKRMAREAFFIA